MSEEQVEPFEPPKAEPLGSPKAERLRIRLPLLLFLATIVTTSFAHGPAFSATLMSIMVAHEMGHYLVARHHGVPASLPHFIPLPPQIFLLGTMGAVITMRTDQARRNQLMDIGAAGPIAGFLVALPLMVLGLKMSKPMSLDGGQVMFFGDSILTTALAKLFGPELPPNFDLEASPVFIGAWAGFLVTAINLLPMGQLDGGHVLYAFTPARAELWARRVYRTLIVLGLVGMVVHGPTLFYPLLGKRIPVAWFEALRPFAPWVSYGFLVWAVLGRATGLRHPPIADPHEALTPGRTRTALACLLIMILTFMPSPLWVDGVWKATP